MELTDAVNNVNSRQKNVLFNKIRRHFDDLNGMTFAVWGLAFKPNTDDVREAPARTLIEALWESGASVRVHDPQAMKSIEAIYGRPKNLIYCDSPMDAADNADALAIVTEWKVYQSPDLAYLFDALNKKVIFDGRNLFDPKLVSSFGLTYYSIGRPVATAPSDKAN
jgi:UDPglucose 6-dehydrogenase